MRRLVRRGTVAGIGRRSTSTIRNTLCASGWGARVWTWTLLDLRRGPHWTLLGFGTHPAQPTGPVRMVGIDAARADVSDPDGHAWEAYGAVDGELVLIRPDGHIGIRGTDAAVVTDYLAAVLPSRDLTGAARP